MLPLRVVVLSALIGVSVALPVAAQWKWRDKTGQMQYSDLPPPAGTADRDILQRPHLNLPRRAAAPGAPASAASAAPSPVVALKVVDDELQARRRQAEQEQAARQKAEVERIAAARADNCARAQSYLRTLDDGMRVVRVNDKGEREFLDDTARADEARRTREVIASDCR
jgi:hypothetical protein